jgi:Protein of unknown function (DUF3800)
VLQAYLDDSGTHRGSPWCVVAGYFGSERKWNVFDRQWRKVLEKEGIEEFHANRFWSSVGGGNVSEYRGWDGQRANGFIGELLKVIQDSHRIFPVSCAVLMDEWHKLTQDERAYLTGAQHDGEGKLLTPGAPNKSYFLPFLTAIRTVLDYCNTGHLVHFLFDENSQLSGYAVQYFREIKKLHLEAYKRMGEISFVDSKRATPIQAADLLAFENYRYGLASLKVNRRGVNPRRVLHAAIKNIRNLKGDSKLFDQRGFDLVLEKFRSLRDKGADEVLKKHAKKG